MWTVISCTFVLEAGLHFYVIQIVVTNFLLFLPQSFSLQDYSILLAYPNLAIIGIFAIGCLRLL
jgi:hypothetical protein